ncbi:type III secretion system cytoplasmic ring protein SctQ [Pseudomonas sp. LT1P18]|uniref:type III secretion system cytoplasmic ring protein SctQ n=1 Tax=Pseudomonas arabinosi TaxID=3398357 RepID=UPI0039F03192
MTGMPREPDGLVASLQKTSIDACDATFEQYDRALLTLNNLLHRSRQPSLGRCTGESIRVHWTVAGPRIEGAIGILFSLGVDTVRLWVPSSALEQWQSILAIPHPALDPLATALLWELTLLELIEPLEQLLGQPIRVSDSTESGAPLVALRLGLEVCLGRTPVQSLQLDMSPASARVVADLLQHHCVPELNDPGQLRFHLAVETGQAWLSLSDLRSLKPGDVVMLDTLPDAAVRVVLSGQLQARAKRDSTAGLRLLEPLNAVNLTMENVMTQPEAAPGVDATLDDLPLKLLCQVGSVELSLQQLRQLGVGSVLQLSSPMQDGVDLMINGRRVGRGQLVQIGDGLGVRVLDFAKP